MLYSQSLYPCLGRGRSRGYPGNNEYGVFVRGEKKPENQKTSICTWEENINRILKEMIFQGYDANVYIAAKIETNLHTYSAKQWV